MSIESSPIEVYVCLQCNISVDNPGPIKGFLRCPAGHRVEGLRSRPLWQVGLLAFLVAFAVLGLPSNVTQGSWLGWCILAGAGTWSCYLLFRGISLLNRPDPINRMGRQYVAVAIARLCAVVVTGFYAWAMLDRGYWPV